LAKQARMKMMILEIK